MKLSIKFLREGRSSHFKGPGKIMARKNGFSVLECIETHNTKSWHFQNAGAGEQAFLLDSTIFLWGQDLVCKRLDFIQ